MATLGSLFGGTFLATRGGEKKTEQGPPVAASSKDEEQFIQYVFQILNFIDIYCLSTEKKKKKKTIGLGLSVKQHGEALANHILLYRQFLKEVGGDDSKAKH